MSIKYIRKTTSGNGDYPNDKPKDAPLYYDTATNLPTYIVSGGSTAKALVDVSTAQTLTNKTLTSPVITSATFSNLSSVNSSTATVSAGYAADTYLAGSGVTIPTSGVVALAQYQLVFDMVKTAAGTATPVITVRYGTAGTTADTALLTFTFAAGTAAADTGVFYVYVTFQTVGGGTSAVINGTAEVSHLLAATGLTSTGAAGSGIITGQTSAGFNSTPAGSIIGVSFNGGASFSGTNSLVQASLRAF